MTIKSHFLLRGFCKDGLSNATSHIPSTHNFFLNLFLYFHAQSFLLLSFYNSKYIFILNSWIDNWSSNCYCLTFIWSISWRATFRSSHCICYTMCNATPSIMWPNSDGYYNKLDICYYLECKIEEVIFIISLLCLRSNYRQVHITKQVLIWL